MNKKCKKCNLKYTSLENYCTKCGIELSEEPNVCSENKSTMCNCRVYAPDDTYCSYCGSLTTYAKEQQERKTQWENGR